MAEQILAKLIEKKQLTKDIFHFKVKADEIVKQSKPGNFIEIRVTDQTEPFLRRPISIYNLDKEKGILEFIFQVKGKGTEILAQKNEGENIDIIGPLGFGTFKLENYTNIAVIGGGIGIFPLYELAKQAKNNLIKVNTYLGFRNKEYVILEEEFKKVSDNLVITTDDGSYKEKGFAIDFLSEDIKNNKIDCIYACGPLPMLKAIKEANENITINDKVLSLKDTTIKNFRLGWSTGNSFIIVVPDDVIENMQIVTELYVFNTKNETTEEDYAKLEKIGFYEIEDSGYITQYFPLTIRGYMEAANKSAMTIFSFSLLYISFIFITVVGTILSIQTLSDSNKNKYQYKLLEKLGVEKKDIHKTIRKQITANFLFPVIYPIIIAVVTSFSINRIFYAVTSASMNYLVTIFITIGIFLVIYGIYYIATYMTFKNNIDEESSR